MPAQDAGVWTAVLPALIVYPHIVYLLSIVRPKEPLSIGGAFAIDALVVGCLGSLPGMPPLLGAGLIYLMLLTLVICLPWRSPFLLPSVAGLLLTLAVQIAAADALWLVLTPFELGAVAFVAGYLLIIGHTVCQRGLKLGAMRRIQGSKWLHWWPNTPEHCIYCRITTSPKTRWQNIVLCIWSFCSPICVISLPGARG